MYSAHQELNPPRRNDKRRHRRGPRAPGHQRHAHAIPLTDEGVPAAIPDAPRPSPVVFVTNESHARFPWLPRRVIAGSVWRGPNAERVQVDESGRAELWRSFVRAAP